ncbi:MAG: VOC family protein [Myxococcales bacterium]|nr:VOC family protein [Myxococcales bacterium]
MPKFTWYDLMTTEPDAAIEFYREVTGWLAERFDPSPSERYSVWHAKSGPVGGVAAHGAPGEAASFLGHVAVEALEPAIERVRHAEGRVLVEPTVIPSVGRFSVVADPLGARFSLFEPDDQPSGCEASSVDPIGRISWHELSSTDASAALAFYERAFGWKKLDALPMGAMGEYVLFGEDSEPYGGMMTVADEPPLWRFYVEVSDLDAAVERAKALGAALEHGPAAVPGGGRVAMLTDPGGARFGLSGS